MDSKEVVKAHQMSYWTQVLHERTMSGEKIEDFCRNRGINKHSYYYWQRKLRDIACSQLAEQNAIRESTDLVPRGFIEIQLTDPVQHPLRTSVATGHGAVRVDIGAIRITANTGYPTEQLAELLKSLAAIC